MMQAVCSVQESALKEIVSEIPNQLGTCRPSCCLTEGKVSATD